MVLECNMIGPWTELVGTGNGNARLVVLKDFAVYLKLGYMKFKDVSQLLQQVHKRDNFSHYRGQ
eukprot:14776941-Ditylum_brightwellii.AAC.1